MCDLLLAVVTEAARQPLNVSNKTVLERNGTEPIRLQDHRSNNGEDDRVVEAARQP